MQLWMFKMGILRAFVSNVKMASRLCKRQILLLFKNPTLALPHWIQPYYLLKIWQFCIMILKSLKQLQDGVTFSKTLTRSSVRLLLVDCLTLNARQPIPANPTLTSAKLFHFTFFQRRMLMMGIKKTFASNAQTEHKPLLRESLAFSNLKSLKRQLIRSS